MQGRAESLGNLNKGHTLRTSRGLPFDASYACTSMHELGSCLFLTIQSQTIHTQRWSQSLTQPGGGHSCANLPYLPLERERESKLVVETKHKRSKHCFSLISPLIIVQSSNQSLYPMCALLHGSSTVTRDKQCVRCIRSKHNLYVYTSFFELLLNYRILHSGIFL